MLEASRYLLSSRVRGEQSFAVVEVERVNGQRSKISGPSSLTKLQFSFQYHVLIRTKKILSPNLSVFLSVKLYHVSVISFFLISSERVGKWWSHMFYLFSNTVTTHFIE